MTTTTHVTMTDLFSAPGEGARADIRRFRTTVRVASDASGGAACVLEHALDPGCVAMPSHRHDATEVLHVLAGTLQVHLDGATRAASAGTCVVIPSGAWHTVWTHPDESGAVRWLAVCAPGGMDRYYADVSAHVPAHGAGAPDVAAVQAASARHGVEVDMLSLYDLVERHGVALS